MIKFSFKPSPDLPLYEFSSYWFDQRPLRLVYRAVHKDTRKVLLGWTWSIS